MTRWHLRSAKLLNPGEGWLPEKDLYLSDGLIVGVGTAPDSFVADEVMDLNGKIVTPALIDSCARIGEPGLEHEGWLESELYAAVAGGVGTLFCPPDTDPVLDEPGLVEMLVRRASQLGLARVKPFGALTVGLAGERISEMVQLSEAGCIALSQADVAIVDTQLLHRSLQYAATFDYLVVAHPCDVFLSKGGMAANGPHATRMGLPTIPALSEVLAVERLLRLAKSARCRLHLSQLSCAESVSLVARAKDDGQNVSADVAVHQLFFCAEDIGYYDTRAYLRPPLRQPKDRDALLEGLRCGVIDLICSNHEPVYPGDAMVAFGESKPGATGLELLLPACLLLADQGMDLTKSLALVSQQVAQVF